MTEQQQADYTIICIVVGEEIPFLVDIRRDALVGHLQEKIKEKQRFTSVIANKLKLFRVDVSVADRSKIQEKIYEKIRALPPPMYPVDKLSKYYLASPPEDMIHILVQHPNTGK
jgi:crinkler effector protein